MNLPIRELGLQGITDNGHLVIFVFILLSLQIVQSISTLNSICSSDSIVSSVKDARLLEQNVLQCDVSNNESIIWRFVNQHCD